MTARRGGCDIKKFREATKADAAGVVSFLFLSENHPGLAISGRFAMFFKSLGHPSLRSCKGTIALDSNSLTPVTKVTP